VVKTIDEMNRKPRLDPLSDRCGKSDQTRWDDRGTLAMNESQMGDSTSRRGAALNRYGSRVVGDHCSWHVRRDRPLRQDGPRSQQPQGL